jgi:hypothetical protein
MRLGRMGRAWPASPPAPPGAAGASPSRPPVSPSQKKWHALFSSPHRLGRLHPRPQVPGGPHPGGAAAGGHVCRPLQLLARLARVPPGQFFFWRERERERERARVPMRGEGGPHGAVPLPCFWGGRAAAAALGTLRPRTLARTLGRATSAGSAAVQERACQSRMRTAPPRGVRLGRERQIERGERVKRGLAPRPLAGPPAAPPSPHPPPPPLSIPFPFTHRKPSTPCARPARTRASCARSCWTPR